ncbi:Uncharacterised protein [Stenotrophomonas maltophilia]|nr:Uncharacterised protein [Stenotrophomonas maltophilia]
MQVDRFDFTRGKAQFGAHLLQQGQVAATAVAEAELRPDPDLTRTQAIDK